MKYDVTLYVACRVKVEGIEAASQEEACLLAETAFADRSGDFFIADDAREGPVWDEGPTLGYLVDEDGDSEYVRTRYHEGTHAQFSAERRAA